ncbi:MAG: tetratricopeptide repeat protein, partial [Verrucomicrobia bacterium]|nr:tetratricopeptide repeat protein [Verrucomicrobiota bacterium]
MIPPLRGGALCALFLASLVVGLRAWAQEEDSQPSLPAMRAPAESVAREVAPDAPPFAIPEQPVRDIGQPPVSEDLPETEDVARVTPAMAKMYEAMVDVQNKKYEEAIPKLEWVLETDPTLHGAWKTLALAYWLSGRRDDARRLGQQFVTIAPGEPRAYNFLAQIATADGELNRAEDLYRQSLQLNPDQYDTRFSYARVLFWSGKRELALEELSKLYERDPARLDVKLQLAKTLYANEEYELSLEHWNHINEMVPDYPDYLIPRAQALALIGALKEAQAEAERILDIEPDNQAALNILTDIAMRARLHEEVVKSLRRVRDRAESDMAKANIARRLAYYMKSQYDRDPMNFTLAQCVQAAQEAYRLDPDDVNGKLFYAEMLALDKEYGRAEEHFLDALKTRNPNSQRARQGLFETYLGRMMLDEAEKQLEENLSSFDPNDPYRHYAWALLLFARGRYFDALESLDRLEQEGAQGAVFTLLYHGLSPSEWSQMPSVRQFRDHMMTLRREGFRFLSPEDFPKYFESLPTPERVERRPWLYRMAQSVRRAFSGEPAPPVVMLRDYTPERVAAVTFDDALRPSFRWATPVAEELRIPLTMFVPVGNILSNDMRIVSWPELREYHRTGVWTIGSHLMDAGTPASVDREGRRANPLPNLIWLEEKDRQETLREYYRRLRREFLESRNILRRELELPEGILTVSYPMGDVGQATDCNIDLFNVPEAVLNEAEIHYRMGFLQSRFGYAMKLDNPMLYQRWEPDRHDSGQDVLRYALQNHPVFLARRTRAEMAALQGEMHKALDMIELLKRDGYPEEDLAELSAYVQRRLARLVAIPAAVKDETDERSKRLVDLRHPYLGVEGNSVKANVMIDEWHVAAKGGFNINPRLSIEGRVGYGRIEQQVTSNFWTQVMTTNVTQRRDITTTTEDGTTTTKDETIVSFVQRLQGTNIVTTTNYTANETLVGLALHYIFRNGSVGTFDIRQRSFDEDLEGESVITYALEYTWRPALAIDMAARYEHDMMPSARAVIEYDGAVLGAVWRIRDWWNA